MAYLNSFKVLKLSSVFHKQSKGKQRKGTARVVVGSLAKLALRALGSDHSSQKKWPLVEQRPETADIGT